MYVTVQPQLSAYIHCTKWHFCSIRGGLAFIHSLKDLAFLSSATFARFAFFFASAVSVPWSTSSWSVLKTLAEFVHLTLLALSTGRKSASFLFGFLNVTSLPAAFRALILALTRRRSRLISVAERSSFDMNFPFDFPATSSGASEL